MTYAGVNNYSYDLNGNQTSHYDGWDTWDRTYDSENRLTEVKKNNTHDGDVRLRRRRPAGQGHGWRRHHRLRGQLLRGGEQHPEVPDLSRRAAGGDADGGTLSFLLGDHLGSQAITADSSGAKTAELLYKAWGENRYTNGSDADQLPLHGAARREYNRAVLLRGTRGTDASLGRFVQADTIVPHPGNPQSFNRYSYVLNNPLRYVDPSGHGANDYYVFAQGCIPIGGNVPCGATRRS